jgi:hypothetical protein
MALTIWLLGAADIFLTHYGRELGVIVEWNPLMAYLFLRSPVYAVGFALVLPGAGLLYLHYMIHRSKLVMPALVGLLVIKLFVMILHVNWVVRM